MDRNANILCLCNKGFCRSVATRFALSRRGYTNVVAIGVTNTSQDLLNDLCKWSDIILLAKPSHADYIPDWKEKIQEEFTIGEDIYQNPYHIDLQNLINEKLNLIGL